MNSITMAAGESLFRDVYVWDDLAHTDTHDITGATLEFEILDRPGGTLVETGGATIINAASGHALIVLEPTQTEDRAGSVLYFVVTMTDALGAIYEIDKGKLRVSRSAL